MKRSLLVGLTLVSLGAMWSAYGQEAGTDGKINQTPAISQNANGAKGDQVAQAGVNDPLAPHSMGQRYRAFTADRGDGRQNLSPTGSDPATEIPYLGSRNRLPYAQGESQ